MIFGLGRGKIEITLEKYNFYPGETIKGNVSLQLKKPIQAEKLTVSFIGMKTVTQLVRASRGSSRRTRKMPVHEFELVLDREKEYFRGDYPFEIKIPDNILQKSPEPEGTLGTIIKATQFISGGMTRVDWYIETSLSIPKALDMKKKVNITLG